jgi:hypothetical protein
LAGYRKVAGNPILDGHQEFIGGLLGSASTLSSMNIPLRLFTDGTARVVYTDLRGRYVLDDDGQPVYGMWLHPDEYIEPVVLDLPLR